MTSLANGGSAGGSAMAVSTTSGASGNPTYVANALNGLGAVQFTGKQALTYTEDTSIRTTFSIFAGSSFLMTDTNGSYNFHRNEANVNNSPSVPLWDGPTQSNWTSPNIYNGTTTVNGVVANYALTNMPTGLNSGFNLVAVQTTGNVAANGFNDDRNWTHYAGNGGSGSQEQGEVIIYNTALTTAQVQTVESYLNSKWSLGLSFPGMTVYGVGGVNDLPAASPVFIASGSTLDLSGGSQQVAYLSDYNGGASSGAGSVINSAATPSVLTLSPTAGSTASFSGVIAGGGALGTIGLTVNGAGTQILAARTRLPARRRSAAGPCSSAPARAARTARSAAPAA